MSGHEQLSRDHGGQYDRPAGCLLRVYWMMIGNAVLLFCAYGITQLPADRLGVADAVYWAVAGSLVVARYVDIRHYHGTTADGDPATTAHWRRYAVLVGAVSLLVWVGARVAARF